MDYLPPLTFAYEIWCPALIRKCCFLIGWTNRHTDKHFLFGRPFLSEKGISIVWWNGLGTPLQVCLTHETVSVKKNHFNIAWNTFPTYRWEDNVTFNRRLMHWLFRLDELDDCGIPVLSFDSLPSVSIVSSYLEKVKRSREKTIHQSIGLSEPSTYIILVLCASWIAAVNTGESFSQLRVLLAPRIISCPARYTHFRRRSYLLTCSDGDKHAQFHRLDCSTAGSAIESRAANTVIMGAFFSHSNFQYVQTLEYGAIRSSFRFTTVNVYRPPPFFSTRKQHSRFLYLRVPSVHNNLLHSKAFTDISIKRRQHISAHHSIPRHKKRRIPICQ